MAKMKVYIVVELRKDDVPVIHGTFRKKSDAESEAYNGTHGWCNIIEQEVK